MREQHVEPSTGAMNVPEPKLLSAEVDDPTGCGRVIKDTGGNLLQVAEEKNATNEERAIREINGGTYVFESKALFAAFLPVRNQNKQNEYYLPDVLYILREQNQLVAIEKADNYREILGINNKEELRKVHAKVFN